MPNELILPKINNFVYVDYENTKGQTMKPKIAVVTISGRAYYLLVNELKRKKASFLSLTPNDNIPIDVKVVITTEKERSRITHENVLTYEEDKNPAEVVDEAIRVVRGKRIYDRLVVGVDPGQNLGVAVLGDGEVLQTKSCSNLRETLDAIKEVLSRTPANCAIVRIGSGVPSFVEELSNRLNEVLPENVTIESVREEGTSQSFGQTSHRRGKRDVNSAIKIGQRQGKALPRRRIDKRDPSG